MYGMVEHTFQPVQWGFRNHAIMDQFQPQHFTPPPMYEPNRDWIRHATPVMNHPKYLPADLRRYEYYPDLIGGYKPYR